LAYRNVKFWFRVQRGDKINYVKWIKDIRVLIALLLQLPARTVAPHGMTGPELNRLEKTKAAAAE
jgi:hypothetical protein